MCSVICTQTLCLKWTDVHTALCCQWRGSQQRVHPRSLRAVFSSEGTKAEVAGSTTGQGMGHGEPRSTP